MNLKPAHNQPANRPSRNAGRFSIAPASARLEDIPQLRGFAHNAHSPRFFPPTSLGSISGGSARRQCFCQIVCAEGNVWFCASASFHRRAKRSDKTRGFTSCHGCFKPSTFASRPKGKPGKFARFSTSPVCCLHLGRSRLQPWQDNYRNI